MTYQDWTLKNNDSPPADSFLHAQRRHFANQPANRTRICINNALRAPRSRHGERMLDPAQRNRFNQVTSMRHDVITRNGIAGVVFAAATAASAMAFAGSHYPAPVTITGTYPNETISGSLGYVHNTPTTLDFIGCSVATYSSGFSTLTCAAQTAAGVYRSCGSMNPDLIARANSIKGDSYIEFTYSMSNGTAICNSLLVNNGSQFLPK